MSLGIGILVLPKYAQFVGLFPAVLLILLGGFINYKTY
jgi:amino acid permease